MAAGEFFRGVIMRIRDIAALAGLTVLASGSLTPASATNGYFSHGYGTKSKAMAGAGVALPLDALAPATNPAAMVLVGPRWDIGVGLFSPDRDYDVKGNPSGLPGTFGLAPGIVESGSTLFFVPHVGANFRLSDRSTFGVAMYGNGGMNTDYETRTFGFTPTGVDLQQLFVAPTVAFKIDERNAVGVTGIVAYQRFKAQGLAAFSFMSSEPGSLTDNGYANSFGGGVRVGYLGEWSRHFSFGASYQTRVWMSEFDKYAGLFAGSGDFDIPSNWVVGVAVKPTDRVDIAFDVQQVRYSEVNAVGDPMLPNMMTAPLGGENGAGFGWDDMVTYKIGTQFRPAGNWTWRAGFSIGEQPIKESEVLLNILAPGVMEKHVTFGVTRDLGPGRAINLSVMRAVSSGVSGANPLEVPGLQTVTLDMDQWDVEVSYSFGFGRR
jgi:long-chain fatty acid transport protein